MKDNYVSSSFYRVLEQVYRHNDYMEQNQDHYQSDGFEEMKLLIPTSQWKSK